MSGPPRSAADALARKVAFLSDPAAYPHAPRRVTAKETHMSWVFLAGDRVWKLKKPVRRPHLDLGTRAARARAACEEVRLNRRLAPDVYLGAASLRQGPDGALTLGPHGEVVDWLVVMRRLPEARTLGRLAARGAVPEAGLDAVARRLVAFYREQPSCILRPQDYADRYMLEHERNAEALTDRALGLPRRETRDALAAFERAFEDARPALEARARAGRVVEGHGDLRPEHVFLTRPPAIIDCLEFSRDLRLSDPFEEIAFLGMECARLGAEQVFPSLRKALQAGLEDALPDRLLAFHWRYRALLRARLTLLHLRDPDPRTPRKWRPLARRYLGLAAQAEVRTARKRGPPRAGPR